MKAIQRTQDLNQRELDAVTPSGGSWHRDYDDTAFIYIGGLPFDLSEGDIVTIFSQYGEPVWIKLARDKETGKSRGFAWLKYEDRRSCELAVDNLSGAKVMDRMLNVDHTRYQKRDDEDMGDNTVPVEERRRMEREAAMRRETESESEEEPRPLLEAEKELMELMRNADEDDPMTAFLIKQKQEEVELAQRALVKREAGRRTERLKRRHHSEEDDSADERCRRQRHRDRSSDRKRESFKDEHAERARRRDRKHRDRSRDRPRRYHDEDSLEADPKQERRRDDHRDDRQARRDHCSDTEDIRRRQKHHSRPNDYSNHSPRRRDLNIDNVIRRSASADGSKRRRAYRERSRSPQSDYSNNRRRRRRTPSTSPDARHGRRDRDGRR